MKSGACNAGGRKSPKGELFTRFTSEGTEFFNGMGHGGSPVPLNAGGTPHLQSAEIKQGWKIRIYDRKHNTYRQARAARGASFCMPCWVPFHWIASRQTFTAANHKWRQVTISLSL
jgi:hypothetical protein